MKKAYLKLLLGGIILLGTASVTSCSNDDEGNEIETVITLKDLPVEAQTFLSTYFSGVHTKSIEKQMIKDIIMYNVEMENGYDIMFDSQGEWQQVEAPDGKTVPSGFYPSGIDEYISQNYNNYTIQEINKTGNGYNVELNNGPELAFNLMGQFTNIVSEF